MAVKDPESYTKVEMEGVAYMSVSDAALYLGVSISTVHNRINSRYGYLESREFAGRLLVTVESVEAEKRKMSESAGDKAVSA